MTLKELLKGWKINLKLIVLTKVIFIVLVQTSDTYELLKMQDYTWALLLFICTRLLIQEILFVLREFSVKAKQIKAMILL